jgi:N-acyl-D-amino-acid deacylase
MSLDILIKNGKIIDGTGNPWYHGDLGIKDGKITKISLKLREDAKRILDASKLIICPGFIDIHSHTDYILPVNRSQESTLCQGVTTIVTGMCGDGMAPIPVGKEKEFKKIVAKLDPVLQQFDYPYHTFAEYLEYNEKKRNSANLAFCVGYGNIRWAGGQGYENRDATSDEMEQMKRYLREAMEAGAFGMSTGLIYAPQIFAKTSELIELAKTVAEFKGLYFSHIRSEGKDIIDAIQEVIEIVEQSGCIGGQIAHHKIAGETFWGTSKQTLKLIEKANEKGIHITYDQYPYSRGMSDLATALPPWVREGENDLILKKIKDPEIQEKIKRDVKEEIEGWENWIQNEGMKNIYISTVISEKWKDTAALNIPEITRMKGLADDWETFFQLLIDNNLSVGITIESMSEEDIRTIMKGRYHMVGTDGFGLPGAYTAGAFHPRCFGTYPRILGKYVRDEKILTIEDAIRKMTSFPASKLRLKDRGLIKQGMWADLVLFDPHMINDKATYENPYQLPEGIPHVLVNGIIVVKDGIKNKKAPGRVLKFQP